MKWLDALLKEVTPDRFFRQYFEREPLYLGKSDDQSLFDPSDLRALVKSTAETCPDRLRANVSGCVLEPPRNASSIDLQRWAFDAYANGATLIINYIESIDLQCARFARALGDAFAAEVSLTVFATPEGAQGFTPHFDTLDVLVIQITGSKDWCLGDSAIQLPTLRQGALLNLNGVQLPIRQRIKLEHRGVLYIPRGVIHWARTSTEASLHVTADICTATQGDLLRASVRRARQSETFRQLHPSGNIRLAHLSQPTSLRLDGLLSALTQNDLLPSLLEDARLAKWALKMSGVDVTKT